MLRGLLCAPLHINYILIRLRQSLASPPTCRTRLAQPVVWPGCRTTEGRWQPLLSLSQRIRVACSYFSPMWRRVADMASRPLGVAIVSLKHRRPNLRTRSMLRFKSTVLRPRTSRRALVWDIGPTRLIRSCNPTNEPTTSKAHHGSPCRQILLTAAGRLAVAVD